MKKNVFFYVFDSMSDWEPGYALAELHSGRFFKPGVPGYIVRTVSQSREPVLTMGGVRILPDMVPAEIKADSEAGILLLPGGETWLEPLHDPIFGQVAKFLAEGIPVAAICGATLGLADHGFLDHRRHTSNDPDYLKAACPAYRGEACYQHRPAVADRDLITASGTAPLEFAREILARLEVFTPETLAAWYGLHRTHEKKYFAALESSLRKQPSAS